MLSVRLLGPAGLLLLPESGNTRAADNTVRRADLQQLMRRRCHPGDVRLADATLHPLTKQPDPQPLSLSSQTPSRVSHGGRQRGHLHNDYKGAAALRRRAGGCTVCVCLWGRRRRHGTNTRERDGSRSDERCLLLLRVMVGQFKGGGGSRQLERGVGPAGQGARARGISTQEQNGERHEGWRGHAGSGCTEQRWHTELAGWACIGALAFPACVQRVHTRGRLRKGGLAGATLLSPRRLQISACAASAGRPQAPPVPPR